MHRSPSRLRGFTLIELLVVIAIIAILAAILFPVFAQAREKARQTACLSNNKQIGNALMMYSQDFDEGLPCWSEHVMTVPPTAESPEKTWQAKLQPYIKSGAPETNNNSGVWQCPSLGSRGERTTINSTSSNPARSYVYNFHLIRKDFGNVAGLPSSERIYIYPNLADMDAPASTVYVTEGTFAGRTRMSFEFAYWIAVQAKKVDGTVGAWEGNEIPDRHNGGSNYIFADGHAKWLNSESTFPKAAIATAPTTAERKKAYGATGRYFAYFAAERAWYQRNGTP